LFSISFLPAHIVFSPFFTLRDQLEKIKKKNKKLKIKHQFGFYKFKIFLKN